MITKRVGPWITTFTGRRVFPLDPRPGEIVLDDLAHALGNLCRFGGHTRIFYSVAQHSVLVSLLVSTQAAGFVRCDAPLELVAWGLLHDAAEAYLGDMIRPLKWWPGWAEGTAFQEAEERLLHVVARKWSLPWPMPSGVKRADEIALLTEARDLLTDPEWAKEAAASRGYELPPSTVEPLPPDRATMLFLERWVTLGLPTDSS